MSHGEDQIYDLIKNSDIQSSYVTYSNLQFYQDLL